MVGYKIAVGIDSVDGPFLVVVKLETLPESTIVTPNNKIQLAAECSILYYVEEILNVCNFYYIPDKKEIQQYRTDAAIVTGIAPIKLDYKPNNWNNKAYSIHDISNRLELPAAYSDSSAFTYMNCNKVYSNLDLRPENTCGYGIHFFESLEDAIYYFAYDYESYIVNNFRQIKGAWRRESKLLKELVK
jgi:hypothetical protein